ncbi:MAG: hypothetical protein RLZ33_469 [Bacteroidota bacterium]|jgi:hypothetical protein
MKIRFIFCLFLLLFFDAKCQKTEYKIEFGGIAYKARIGSIMHNYSLGLSWKRQEKIFYNEISLTALRKDFYPEANIQGAFEMLTYGKAYELNLKCFVIKPSLNLGIFYWDYNTNWNGFSYSLGLVVDPSIQLGFEIKDFQLLLRAHFPWGIGYSKWYLNTGENNQPAPHTLPINRIAEFFLTPTLSIKL